jgi:hypothetical protein
MRCCSASGWTLSSVHFYTGIPSVQDDPFWNHFWSAKLAVLGTRGVVTFSRHLRYRNQTVALPDATTTTVLARWGRGFLHDKEKSLSVNELLPAPVRGDEKQRRGRPARQACRKRTPWLSPNVLVDPEGLL